MSRIWLGSIGSLAIISGAVAWSPALADFSGTLDGEYAYVGVDNNGGSGNVWGGNASGRISLGPWGLNAQIDGGYHSLSATNGGPSLNNWDANGTLFWLGSEGRVGASVGYNDLSTSGFDGHIVNYGGFAEWYGTSSITVGIKGGGVNASNGGGSGDYVGGELVWYVIPDLNANATVDYLTFGGGHLTNYSGEAEWLVSEDVPVSVFGGYTRTEASGGIGANTWLVGLKLYTNSNGASTLVDRQRTGNADWGSRLSTQSVLATF